MAISNQTNVAYIYKVRYSDRKVGDVARRAHPVMSMMRKEDGMDGQKAKWTYAIRYGNPQSVSGTFTDTQDYVETSKGIQFEATRRDCYGTIRLDGPSMAAARTRKGAFLDLVTQESDGIIEERGDALSHQLFGDGHGHLGQRSSASTNSITLTDSNTARHFKIGMSLVADDTEAGTSLRSGTTKVDGVDPDAGTIDLVSAAALISFADNDYLFRKGDPTTIIDGFAAHIPLTTPTLGSDSFRGEDRAVYANLLAGSRIDDTSTPILENAGLLSVKISDISATAGAKEKILVLNPLNFWAVSRQLNAKVTYDGGGQKATAMFAGFDIACPTGVMRAVADPHCPTNRGYVLALGTWYWKHLMAWCHVIRDDKNAPFMRVAAADQIEMRIRCMGNPCCDMPAANGVFSISA